MNVNLSPVVSSTQAENVAPEHLSEDIENSDDSGGFLHALHQFFSGDDEAQVREVSKQHIDAQHSNSDAEVTDVKQEHKVKAGAEDDDAQVAADAEHGVIDDASGVETDVKDAAESALQKDKKSASKTESESIDDAMAAGQQLLGRLEQANSTLKTSADGKKLPHQSELGEELDIPVSAQLLKEVNTAGDVKKNAALSAQDTGDDKKVLSIPFSIAAQIEAKIEHHQPLSKQEQAIVSAIANGQLVIAKQDAPVDPRQLSLLAEKLHLTSDSSNGNDTAAKTALDTSAFKAAVSQVAKSPVNGDVNQIFNNQLQHSSVLSADAVEKSALDSKLLRSAVAAQVTHALSEKQAKDSGSGNDFAAQLGTLAAHQGIANSQALRTDIPQPATITSAPLQLTREMAGEQLAEKVQMMMSKNLKNLDIRLDPPELGRLHIRMTMNNDIAQVHFTVASPQARDMIENSMPRLREMLAQQGMQLADSSVQQQSQNQQGQYGAAGHGNNASELAGLTHAGDENTDTGVKLDLHVATKRDGISFYA